MLVMSTWEVGGNRTRRVIGGVGSVLLGRVVDERIAVLDGFTKSTEVDQ